MLTLKDLQQYTTELSKKITFNTENLYQHNIMVRFNDGNRKACTVIINNDNMNYSSSTSRFVEYMKKVHSATNDEVTGNIKNTLPCDGYYKNASGLWYVPKFLFYSTTDNAIRCLGMRSTADSAPNNVVVLGDHGNSFSVHDNVYTIALNNVNKPSYKTVSTKLSLGGTAETSANVNWTCYKYPLGDGKFKYEWVGNYRQTKSVAITTNYGSLFMSAKFSIALPDANMVGKCIVTGSQLSSTEWIVPSIGGTSLDFYMLRATSATINNLLELNITCSYVGD